MREIWNFRILFVFNRSVLHYSELIKGWCLPFPGSDKSIVARTERYCYSTHKQRPIQVNTYVTVGGLMSSIFLMIGAVMFGVIAQFKWGRYLLEKVRMLQRQILAGFYLIQTVKCTTSSF